MNAAVARAFMCRHRSLQVDVADMRRVASSGANMARPLSQRVNSVACENFYAE